MMKPTRRTLLSKLRVGFLLSAVCLFSLSQLLLILHDYLATFRDGTNYELAIFTTTLVVAGLALRSVFGEDPENKMETNLPSVDVLRPRKINYVSLGIEFAHGFITGFASSKNDKKLPRSL